MKTAAGEVRSTLVSRLLARAPQYLAPRYLGAESPYTADGKLDAEKAEAMVAGGLRRACGRVGIRGSHTARDLGRQSGCTHHAASCMSLLLSRRLLLLLRVLVTPYSPVDSCSTEAHHLQKEGVHYGRRGMHYLLAYSVMGINEPSRVRWVVPVGTGRGICTAPVPLLRAQARQMRANLCVCHGNTGRGRAN